MGIPGLMSYMMRNAPAESWKQIDLTGRPVVIDGNNLCHVLYDKARLRKRAPIGCPYPAYYRATLRFFQSLARHNVKPVVVRDGVKGDISKGRRQKQVRIDGIVRYQNRESRELPVPSMIREVFYDVLRLNPNLGDIHFATYEEADSVVTAIANSLKCPVLSGDSDFFIYEIPSGFVLTSCLDISDECELRSSEARAFFVDQFAEAFNFQDKDLRLLLPAYLGSDHNTKHPSNLRPADVIARALEFSNLDACLELGQPNDRKLLDNIQQARKQYIELPPASYPFDPTTLSGPFAKLPTQYHEKFCKGNFQTFMAEAKVHQQCIFGTVLEDVSSTGEQTAQGVSLPIRKSIYQILECSSPITEIRRESNLLVEIPIEIHDQPCITLDQILQLSEGDPQLEKQKAFLSILKCDIDDTSISRLPKHFQLLVVATIYWYSNTQPEPDFVRMLIACFVTCSQSKLPRKSQDAPFHPPTRGTSELRLVHSLTQWQCIYYDVVALNQLLMEPFQYRSLSQFFDDKSIVHFYHNRRRIEEMLKDVGDQEHELYHELFSVCTSKTAVQLPAGSRRMSTHTRKT